MPILLGKLIFYMRSIIFTEKISHKNGKGKYLQIHMHNIMVNIRL